MNIFVEQKYYSRIRQLMERVFGMQPIEKQERQVIECNHSFSNNIKSNKSSNLFGLKIIFVFAGLNMGGAERQGILFADYLKKRHKANVEIWGLHTKSGKVSELCNRLGIPWRGIYFGAPRVRPIFLVSLLKFSFQLRGGHPDIVLSYAPLPNIVCGITWFFSGAKIYVWNQRDEGRELNSSIWCKLAVRCTRYFFANSSDGLNHLIKTYNVKPDKIKCIPNTIFIEKPLKDRKTWREQLGIAPECFAACMVANLHRFKDHPTLFRAWRELLDIIQDPCIKPILLLAGRFDSGTEELKKLAHDLKIIDNVRFLGAVDDIYGLLNSVDLCVHSSNTEGCPNAVLEAMKAGLPVVGTDIAGIRDAVGANGLKFLVPPNDFKTLAKNIMLFLKDKELRCKIGVANKIRADKEFDTEKIYGETANILCEYLNQSRKNQLLGNKHE